MVLPIEGRPPVPRFCGSRCIVCLRCSPTPAGPLRRSPVLPAGARRYCVSTNPAWRPPVLFPAGARRYSVCRNPIVTAVCLGACSRVVSAYRRKARSLSLSLSIYGMYQAIRNQFSTPEPQNPHSHHAPAGGTSGELASDDSQIYQLRGHPREQQSFTSRSSREAAVAATGSSSSSHSS